eukprot:241830-Pyramimonas_sp.AAC.1
MDKKFEPAVQDTPPDPQNSFEGAVVERAWVDRNIRIPRPPPTQTSALISGAGGDEHPPQVCEGS